MKSRLYTKVGAEFAAHETVNHSSALGVTDGERAELAIKGIEGKRLTYRLPH